MPQPNSYNSIAINGSSPYRLVFPINSEFGYGVDLQLAAREGGYPQQYGAALRQRNVEFLVTPGDSGVPSSYNEWRQNVMGLFIPDGVKRSLRASWRSQTIEVFAAVTDIGLVEGVPAVDDDVEPMLNGIFTIADPIWREISAETADSTSPLTVSRGNTPAQPTITLTPSTTTVRRRTITITDTLGIGLSNYPIIASFDGSGVSANAATNNILFINGREVPIRVNNPGANPQTIIFRVNCEPGGSVVAHLYYGSSVSNTLTSSAFDPGGMAITDADLSNTNWIWDNFKAFDNPRNACGVWTPSKFGINDERVGITFTDDDDSWNISKLGDQPPVGETNGVSMVIGGAIAGTSNALSGLARVYGSRGGSAGDNTLRLLAKYQPATAVEILTALDEVGNSTTISTPIDVDQAIALQLYAITKDTGALATQDLELQASGDFALALTNTPSVIVGAAVTARFVDATLTNTTTGDTIQFDKLYMDNTTLVIDCVNKTITSSQVFHRRAIRFSNREKWFTLAVGSNAWTNATNLAASFSWKPSYRI